jgi:hypothetical protein
LINISIVQETIVVNPQLKKTKRMKLAAFKEILKTQETIGFELPNGTFVPSHFHVTEVGQIDKKFIDCGGTLRNESLVNFQLWEANDYDHRLHPEKLVAIIELSEKELGLTNEEIEVEYQGITIGKYGIEFNGKHFCLTNKKTDCLAKDNCGVPEEKTKISMVDLAASNTCTPGSGCC